MDRNENEDNYRNKFADNIMKQVSKINRRRCTATEYIPDNELQKIVLFVFENKGKNNCADTFGRGL